MQEIALNAEWLADRTGISEDEFRIYYLSSKLADLHALILLLAEGRFDEILEMHGALYPDRPDPN